MNCNPSFGEPEFLNLDAKELKQPHHKYTAELKGFLNWWLNESLEQHQQYKLVVFELKLQIW
jgi:hypothetical protein